MKGRKPIPTSLKLIGGSRKDRINKDEPKLRAHQKISCPKFLSKEARKEWRRLIKGLQISGILTEFDRSTFAAYCQAYGRWIKAENTLDELRVVAESQNNPLAPEILSGPNGLYQNPLLAVSNKAWEQMIKASAELGITPSSRSRIVVSKPKKPGGIGDLID